MKIEVSTLVGCFGQAVRKNGDSQVQGHHRLLFFPSSSAEQRSPPVPLLLLRHHRYHRHHCLSRRQCFQYSHSLRPRLPPPTSHFSPPSYSHPSIAIYIYVARITPVTYQLRSCLGPASTVGKGRVLELDRSDLLVWKFNWLVHGRNVILYVSFFVHIIFIVSILCKKKKHSYHNILFSSTS